MRKNILYGSLSILFAVICIIACNDAYLGLEHKKTDSVSPGKLTVDRVEPKPGALEVFFTLPKGESDIVQILASYTNKQGEAVDFTVSRYAFSVLVEGFTGTDEVTLNLKCVDNSGNESELVEVKASPLLSPVELARQSMEVEVAFGGVKLNWENVSGDMLVIHVLTEDTMQIKGQDVFVEDVTKRIYTNDTLDRKTFAYVRQYPDKEQKFGFYVSDKWGNATDTLTGAWTPIREDIISTMNQAGHITEVDAFQWEYCQSVSKDYETHGIIVTSAGDTLQKDGFFHAAWYRPGALFNRVLNNRGPHFTRFTRNLQDDDPSNDEYVMSVFMTYNLNIDTRLSRMKIHPRKWMDASPKKFRVWGTDDSNPSKYLKFPGEWTLIGEYEFPDFITHNSPTQEELDDRANNGVEFSVMDDNVSPDGKPATVFRYMRLEFFESFVNNKTQKIMALQEMQLWGQIEKEYY
ncbi:MAG: DUF5126 domain-containing protein [Bacteroidales bacterium]